MKRRNHSLKTLKFDISFYSEKEAVELHQKISKLSSEKIYAIIAKTFDEELPDEHVFVQLENLEIDLGEIAHSDLEQLLPGKISSLLKQVIRRRLLLTDHVHPAQPTVLKKPEDQYNAETLYYFLQNGSLPWWASDEAGRQLESLFTTSLKTRPKELLAVVYTGTDFLTVLRRIVYQFSDTVLKALVNALTPAYGDRLIEYSRQIVQHAGVLKPVTYTPREYQWLKLLTFLHPNGYPADKSAKSMIAFFIDDLAAGNDLTIHASAGHPYNKAARMTTRSEELFPGSMIERLLAGSAKQSEKKFPDKAGGHPGSEMAPPPAADEHKKIDTEKSRAGMENTISPKSNPAEANAAIDDRLAYTTTESYTNKPLTAGVAGQAPEERITPPAELIASDVLNKREQEAAEKGPAAPGKTISSDTLTGQEAAEKQMAAPPDETTTAGTLSGKAHEAAERQTATSPPKTTASDSLTGIAQEATEKQMAWLPAEEAVPGEFPGIEQNPAEKITVAPPDSIIASDELTGNQTQYAASVVQEAAGDAGNALAIYQAELTAASALLKLKDRNGELYQYLNKFIGEYNSQSRKADRPETEIKHQAADDDKNTSGRPEINQATADSQASEGIAAGNEARQDQHYLKPSPTPPGNSAEEEASDKVMYPGTAVDIPGELAAITKDLQPFLRELLMLKQQDSELYWHIINFTVQYNQKWQLNRDNRVYARDLFDYIMARYRQKGAGLQILEATLIKMGYRAGRRNQEHPRFREAFTRDKVEVYFVQNAGLVLLGPALPAYYERLFLTKDNEFISKGAQCKAVHMLQFLADGKDIHTEDTLVLNKVLCGMDITEPLEKEVVISQAGKETAYSLLNAVKDNWPALKNSGTDTFRTEFLQRSGKLSFYNNEWVLRVEHNGRSDYLLDTLPWSFKTIKYSWMPEILNVEWT